MKKILVPILAITFFVACKGKDASSAKDTVVNSSTSKNQTDELIKKFKPILEGHWVKKDYIDEIAATKSPQKAYLKVGNITDMMIDTSKIKADSISVDYNSGNHEVFNLIIKFHAGNSSNSIIAYDPVSSIERNYYELKINKENTLLTIYTFDKNRKISDSANYFKVSKDENEKRVGDEPAYIINKILVIGNYTMRDSSNNLSKVSFKNGSKVSGITDFKTYNVSIDFMTPPNNLDEITFDPTSKNSKSFAFKINVDTLSLYETRQAADSVDLELGKLKYKLVRQK
jgi:hypothetical protein